MESIFLRIAEVEELVDSGFGDELSAKALMFFLCGGDGEAYALQIADCVAAKSARRSLALSIASRIDRSISV